MSMSHYTNKIEDILQQKTDEEKHLFNLYRLASEEAKPEVVLALIGMVISERKMRKAGFKG